MVELPEATGEDWEVRINGHPRALAEACAAAGVSPNAMRLHDLDAPGHATASVEWPSYFCERTDLVLILAYLVRNHLPFDMQLVFPDAADATRGATYMLHPPLDEHSRALLSEINPRKSAALGDLQERVETVLARLRQGHLIERE